LAFSLFLYLFSPHKKKHSTPLNSALARACRGLVAACYAEGELASYSYQKDFSKYPFFRNGRSPKTSILKPCEQNVTLLQNKQA
jgi:hypothetical protein